MTATADGLVPLSAGAPLRLLLIEDSTPDSELVLALLEDGLPHAKVDVVSSLAEALVELAANEYDAALADLSLPDADGLAVVRAVRAAHPSTALLVHTSRADGSLAMWALAEGAQDYLVKGERDGADLAVALLHALQRQRTAQEEHRYLELARGLLDALEAPTCAVDGNGRIVAVNRAWRAATTVGASGNQWGEGTAYESVSGLTMASKDPAITAEVTRGLRDVMAHRTPRFQLEYACDGPGGERWVSVRISPAEVDGVRGAVVSHVDVTAMHQVQEALSHQALHDPLTGLPNRLLLTDRLSQALVDAERRGSEVGVGFLDLDHFKRINDSLGHAAGDDLLALVGERLRGQLRAGDTLARYSGDEFVVVWRDLASSEEVTALIDRIVDAMVEPFTIEGTSITVSASLGVVVGAPGQGVEQLLQDADAAMYDAKLHARGRSRIFREDMRRDAHARMTTEVSLRSALANSELVLHYQPVINLATGRPVGLEALVRWQHPERGLLAPGEFVPVAEVTGLILPLGRWVLDRACQDAASLTGVSADLDIAVNLSTRQLTQPDVIKHVQEALRYSNLDPARLVLEVTESALMEDEDAASIALEELSRLGVRIAIDDFGTGYSSLLYLRRYPISTIKLDRAFVAGIGLSADDEAICRSVVNLAGAVGATSIGEGVETAQQYAALRSYGCQQAQGHLWSPAVAIEELSDVLAACARVPAPAPESPVRGGSEPLDAAVAQQIATLHQAGASLHTIAAVLNGMGVHSPNGKRWTGTSVARHFAAEALTQAAT